MFNDHPEGSIWQQECVGEREVGHRAGATTLTEPLGDGRTLVAVAIYSGRVGGNIGALTCIID